MSEKPEEVGFEKGACAAGSEVGVSRFRVTEKSIDRLGNSQGASCIELLLRLFVVVCERVGLGDSLFSGVLDMVRLRPRGCSTHIHTYDSNSSCVSVVTAGSLIFGKVQ